MIQNPYIQLHKEFIQAGARVLLSSGQACVMYGIAAFSKDGDWIIQETSESCNAVLDVLTEKGACYRLGAPLDIRWLSRGLTSHFEFRSSEGIRVRADFVSRPPRVLDLKKLWDSSFSKSGIELIDLESLLSLKQTRRQRDYSIIGTLAEVCGFNEGKADIALTYIQDYDNLKKAVEKWPEQSRQSQREAVRLLVSGASRKDVVVALAIEQDHNVEADNRRIELLQKSSRDYGRKFIQIKSQWDNSKVPLRKQHEELLSLAALYIKDGTNA